MSERQKASQFRNELRQWSAETKQNIHVVTLMDARNTKLKPYDSYFVWRSAFVAVEFKLLNSGTFNVGIFKDHQKQGLEAAHLAGGVGLGIVFIRAFPKIAIVLPIRCLNDSRYARVKIEELRPWYIRRHKDGTLENHTHWDFNTLLHIIEMEPNVRS
jgi:hypothetical protein